MNWIYAGIVASVVLVSCFLDFNYYTVVSALEPKATVYSREHDIEKWKLAKTELPSYDACQTALALTTGAVPSGAYCGCLVVAGATSLQTLSPQKLRPLLVASFMANPVPVGAKSAVPVEMASAIEAGSPGCRKPERPREAGSIGSDAPTGRGWRVIVRRQPNEGYVETRKLPLLADHRY